LLTTISRAYLDAANNTEKDTFYGPIIMQLKTGERGSERERTITEFVMKYL
jgi:hypothetical protein